jgi:hypothetical protein
MLQTVVYYTNINYDCKTFILQATFSVFPLNNLLGQISNNNTWEITKFYIDKQIVNLQFQKVSIGDEHNATALNENKHKINNVISSCSIEMKGITRCKLTIISEWAVCKKFLCRHSIDF